MFLGPPVVLIWLGEDKSYLWSETCLQQSQRPFCSLGEREALRFCRGRQCVAAVRWAAAGGYGRSPVSGWWAAEQMPSFPAAQTFWLVFCSRAAVCSRPAAPGRKYLHPVLAPGSSSAASCDGSASCGWYSQQPPHSFPKPPHLSYIILVWSPVILCRATVSQLMPPRLCQKGNANILVVAVFKPVFLKKPLCWFLLFADGHEVKLFVLSAAALHVCTILWLCCSLVDCCFVFLGPCTGPHSSCTACSTCLSPISLIAQVIESKNHLGWKGSPNVI